MLPAGIATRSREGTLGLGANTLGQLSSFPFGIALASLSPSLFLASCTFHCHGSMQLIAYATAAH